MGLTKYQNELRDAISNGCVELLRQLISEDLHALHTVNPVGIRDLDYLLYYSLVHNNVDEQSLELCRAVFDAGANPNVSFYNQSQVGYLVD